ncbi:tetrahydromethanopterin S-methyltransferase subunit A [Methanohalophilus mahii]|uniref:Tetrahydromethanopterin S-methyltransferase, subunit A n=1 Tax=Methanohalophilus mahii (strain ATCC 35705 / DSM 5219 / SLP) TaxID=547558 RepID=D5E6K1_METMS|nr:tetrahydromethanopterin S-methyltransferase subunit A [Methanohalophilus mahii]ADE36789.1 tetrahydromethanopterin S-methyltransferase, subunit A [Methanohalophilus mahii DSM 5219]
MATNKSTDPNNWPMEEGDYVIGDPDSPVAVVTLTSDYRNMDCIHDPCEDGTPQAEGVFTPGYKKPCLQNYAICGTCFTENFGIQKVIANILSNPKINCLIVCGKESKHFAGQSIIALVENGVSTMADYKKIIGSKGVIPYLDEIPMTAINHFLKEIEVIDLIDTTDPETIQKVIDSCKLKERSEAKKYPIPQIDENSWRKYENMIQKNVMSKIKK